MYHLQKQQPRGPFPLVTAFMRHGKYASNKQIRHANPRYSPEKDAKVILSFHCLKLTPGKLPYIPWLLCAEWHFQISLLGFFCIRRTLTCGWHFKVSSYVACCCRWLMGNWTSSPGEKDYIFRETSPLLDSFLSTTQKAQVLVCPLWVHAMSELTEITSMSSLWGQHVG